MTQCEGIYDTGWIVGLGCRGLADASGGLGKTPLPGHRYATLLRSGGYAAPDANICYNSFVRGKIVSRGGKWENRIERLGIRGVVHRRSRLTLGSA